MAPPALPPPPPASIPVPHTDPIQHIRAKRKTTPIALAAGILVLAFVTSLFVVFVILSWAVPQVDVAGWFHTKPTSTEKRKPSAVDRVVSSRTPPASKQNPSPENPSLEVVSQPLEEPPQPEQPQVVSTWQHFVAGAQRGNVVLYSNGKLNDPYGIATWNRVGDQLTFNWPNDAAPGGVWVDECTVSPDGNRYSGRNQLNARIEGVLIP